jgi:uncharacterized protein YPO0396
MAIMQAALPPMRKRPMIRTDPIPQLDFTLPPAGKGPGMRLQAVEVLNWGTFDKRVWSLNLGGENALLTGDIGSGKSTLVDAITTLLVPANRIAYNKAAGAEARERDLRSYVLGHYKSERGDTGLAARAVALRDYNSYSVILARFRNDGFGEDVTLAQLFYFRDRDGQPTRFYVVSGGALSIAKHFTFEKDIAALKKQLRKLPRTEVHDSFPPYGAAFRRQLSIENEQALNLFHQTVSMKSVGDLTDFVRSHMLEAFGVESRIDQMIGHFNDLNRAHEAVLKAKDQIGRLEPLVADCKAYTALTSEVDGLRACREALGGYFAEVKAGLVEARIAKIENELTRLDQRLEAARRARNEELGRRDAIKQAIAANGGDRIESLGREIAGRTTVKAERQRRAEQYDRFAKALGLLGLVDADAFVANTRALAAVVETAQARLADLDNALTEEKIAFRRLKDEHAALTAEIKSLEGRRSNLPARMLAIRSTLCEALSIEEALLPFAGELIEIRREERDWEGAAERLLHGFAQSLLVPDELYARVSDWVDRTHLAGRLVYFRVRPQRQTGARPDLHPRSLVLKLAIKPDSPFYTWLDREIAQRFDYACCASLDAFRREDRAVTRMGQMKARGERHEKDDRFAIDDRTRFVLGWSNEDKIRAFETAAHGLEARMDGKGGAIAKLETEQRSLHDRLRIAGQLTVYTNFPDLDWESVAVEIEQLEAERRQLEAGSDTLRVLRGQLAATEQALAEIETRLAALNSEHGSLGARRQALIELREDLESRIAAVETAARQDVWPRLESPCSAALGDTRMTVESCEGCEKRVRDWLQARIDAEDKKIARLREAIVKAMQTYRVEYPAETREVDDVVDSAPEYAQMLAGLVTDGLPRFEARFKALLNENTIREVAGFQSQLNRERQMIRERIELINQSLREIDYNTGRYIELVVELSLDQDVRQFVQDLRGCTEGALTGSDDAEYSEAKFLAVKRIIERFKGRAETADLDRRWTRKVTDVRNWFVFSASERWREDGREHEHYTDSGGKSGGQKEKLAYTVLAASLAYQFGIDWRAPHSRSFHFVVIDEAFGRGSDESARYGLDLFAKMNLQLLVATPLQKIHIIEPFVAAVGLVHNEGGSRSLLRNLTIEELRAERLKRAG